ncbi:class I SAM-dependent methyltransferase [Candidatus Pelagibacter sp.]|uniref:class I SAM-dependent methyltransferase n=1 Tax=Candidatus Pelagibacter sp. TaxID=2024849 RepID=UPI003F84C24C
MFFLKLKYFLHYYKSKALKKRCKKDYASQKKIFEQKLDHKNFSQKWFLNNFEIFTFFLPKDKSLKFDYLEVGCYEGLSSFYVLSEYKSVNAFFLDIWDMPNSNSKTLSHNFGLIEKAFDQNLSGFDFKKMKNDSVISMRKLLKENVHFDFIYIDGSHNGEDILSDAIEAFKILKVNGLMFFDDFLQHDDNRILQSYVGIDKFLSLYSDYLKIEYFQNNLVVRKK